MGGEIELERHLNGKIISVERVETKLECGSFFSVFSEFYPSGFDFWAPFFFHFWPERVDD